MDERDLVRRTREGDEGAFREIVMKHRNALLAYGYRLTGSVDAAKDLVQEAFFRLYRNISSIDCERPLKNWLYKVVTNLAIDSWRKRQREVPITREIMDIEIIFEPENEDVRRLDECMRRLPLRQRTALTLYYGEGYSIKEIAEIMSCSEGTVKAHLFKGRENLRKCMGGTR